MWYSHLFTEGRPIQARQETFESYEAVAEALVDVPERTSVLRVFDLRVVGGLVDVEGIEHLRLYGWGKTGLVRRYKHMRVEEGITVSTASLLGYDVVSHVEPWDSELLDRGLAWVSVASAELPPLFHVGVKPEHGLGAPAIAERLATAEKRAVETITDVLNSNPEPRFARTA